jgi:hypothetical protein
MLYSMRLGSSNVSGISSVSAETHTYILELHEPQGMDMNYPTHPATWTSKLSHAVNDLVWFGSCNQHVSTRQPTLPHMVRQVFSTSIL